MSSQDVVTVRGLTIEYQTKEGCLRAADSVDLRIAPSEVVGLVGETGSGKSVTVRAIIGLVRPPGRIISGRITVLGYDVLSMSRSRLRQFRGPLVGFIGQNPFSALNPLLRVGTQIKNVFRAHGKHNDDEIRLTALEVLEAVGIPSPDRILDLYPHELSGGMAQRVVIAIAMSLDPPLIIADEPTTALDVSVQRQILDCLDRLVRDNGRSLLLVTHDLAVVAQYCDRVVVMRTGQVVEEGPVDTVLMRPADPYTRKLLAASRALELGVAVDDMPTESSMGDTDSEE